MIKVLRFTAFLGVLAGCATGPSGHWEQAGRTPPQIEDDEAHCRKVAMLESDGQRSVDPFKEAKVEESCMRRMGYTSVKAPR